MSRTELIIRVISKSLLIIGAIILLGAGSCVESLGISKVIPMAITGTAMAVPDVLIWMIGGMYIDKQD